MLAPTGRDALLTCKLLERSGITCAVCPDMSELCRMFEQDGAAALMLAEEVLVTGGLERLSELLARQSPWSDVPVLIFTGLPAALRMRQKSSQQLLDIGNVTLLDRPLRPVTMLSAARTALRARRRQYEARTELQEQQRGVRQRDQFLAMLGHELRNPLSALAMALSLEGDGTCPEYRDIMLRQVSHLTHLVDDLLDVSRVTSGKIILRREPEELVALVQRSVSALVRGKRNDITVEHEGPVWIDADRVRIEQVINNLVHNAVKYTPPGGHVLVRVHADQSDAVVEVRDTGIGLAPDMIDQVFELFTQAEGSLDRSQGGMGIGLTLVRNLVELHDGTVAAASPGLGKGSIFTVRLPRAPPAAAAEATHPSREVPQLLGPQPSESATQHDVLIVEDNEDSRELLATLVGRRGYRVLTAPDGPTGITEASRHHPRVLLVDIGLPGVDGYEVARQVRELFGNTVFMVALTGYGQPDDRARALDAGFDMHLTKPVDVAALATLLAEHIAPSA